MKKASLLVLAMAAAMVSLSGYAAAGDQAPDAYAEFDQKARPLHQELNNKRFELDSLFRGGNVDEAKKQELINDIASLQAQLFALKSEFHAKAPSYGYHNGGYGRGMGMGMGMHHGGGGRRGHGGYGGPGYGGPGYGGHRGGGMGMGGHW